MWEVLNDSKSNTLSYVIIFTNPILWIIRHSNLHNCLAGHIHMKNVSFQNVHIFQSMKIWTFTLSSTLVIGTFYLIIK